METNGRNHFGLWKGLMVGGFLGAAASILFAPKCGEELRSEIKHRTDKALGETRRFYSDARTKFKDRMACFCGRKEQTSMRHIEPPERMGVDA